MTISDYLLNATLVALVILQIRGHKITAARLLFPLVATVVVGLQYLHGVPTAGNDLVLVSVLGVAGATLGLLAGLATSVGRVGETAIAKAGATAAALWIVGIGARMGFYFWSSHGGESAIANFSIAHQITSGSAWATAFILMAMAEVGVRTSVLYFKTRRTGAVIPRGGLLHRTAAA